MTDGSPAHLQSLIDRCNTGDTAALNALIRHTADRLLRLARKIFHQDFQRIQQFEETDDVLNAALMKLVTALRATRLASVTDYFRLATLQIRRALLDMGRNYPPRAPFPKSQRRAESGDSSQVDDDPSDYSHEPQSLMFWQEFHERAERLPESERDVFDLLWYQSLTQEEAAAVLQVSVPTVKRRWLRARVRLKDYLRFDGPGSEPKP